MGLIDINLNPDNKDLRIFALAGLAASIIIAILLYATQNLTIKQSLCIGAVGLSLFVLSVVYIKAVKFIYIALILVTYPIGTIFSMVVLAIFYYLIITPVGLFFKIIGRDTLRHNYRLNVDSYWVSHKMPDNIKRYFQQF